jgi:hypothetical protein
MGLASSLGIVRHLPCLLSMTLARRLSFSRYRAKSKGLGVPSLLTTRKGNPPFLVGFWRRRVEETFYLEKHETQLSRMLQAVRLRRGRAYPDQCQRLVSKQAAPALALWGPAER